MRVWPARVGRTPSGAQYWAGYLWWRLCREFPGRGSGWPWTVDQGNTFMVCIWFLVGDYFDQHRGAEASEECRRGFVRAWFWNNLQTRTGSEDACPRVSLRIMKKVTTLSALAVLAGIAVYDIGFRGNDDGEGMAGAHDASDLSAELAEVKRGRVPLSKGEIIDRLPKAIPLVGGTSLRQGQSDHLEIFAKLGALEGEAAVDYIFERYGKGQSSYLPMTFAMKGWMETDLEAGLAAFKGFLKNGRVGFAFTLSSGGLFEWKGVGFSFGAFVRRRICAAVSGCSNRGEGGGDRSREIIGICEGTLALRMGADEFSQRVCSGERKGRRVEGSD